MPKVALVSHDVQTVQGRAGGVGAFVTHFATLLKEAGEEVTIVLARAETEPREVDAVWKTRYQAAGIQLIERHNTPPQADRWSDAWPVRLSEQIAPLLEDFDIVYFSDWANVGFLPVREKRFSPRARPVLVTVLHGPAGWVRAANREYPQIPEDLHVDFIERYSAQHSDFVVAPSRYMLNWVRTRGWKFQSQPEVLGLPFCAGALDAVAGRTAPISRLVFVGRLEPRKGYGLFVDALRLLASRDGLRQVGEVVLLGPEHERAVASQTRRELDSLGVPVAHLANLDSAGVRRYLSEHASGALAIVASPVENFPYAVIEASCIPGLNLICSRGGGIPEIFEQRGEAQLFDPHPAGLAAKIEERLKAPLPANELVAYNFSRANRRWLEFHARACRHGRAAPAKVVPRASVDVCITYFNKQQHFPQLLQALAQQTVTDFRVIAVDDGSTDAEARETFDHMAVRYASRGWTFFRQQNAFVDAARNRAAERSAADYLMFIDADDLPASNAIERLREAILLSGCDCLLTYGRLLMDDGELTAHYAPLGPDLVSGLVDPIIFGLHMILVRRKVFEALGGYREIRGAAHEDWELQLRLLLGHYQTDVLPEYLLFFRRPGDGLANKSDDFAAKHRLLETYETYLSEFGLNGMATAMFALRRRGEELESVLRQNVPLDVRLRLHQRLRSLLNQGTP